MIFREKANSILGEVLEGVTLGDMCIYSPANVDHIKLILSIVDWWGSS